MQNWIISLMGQYGYLGVFLLITLENVFPPIPSEVILALGGFMTTYTNLTVLGVIIAATVGSVFGAMILYGIGYLIDVDKLERIVGRFGYLLGLKVADVHRAGSWFQRYGYWTVFFCRMVPVIRSLISIPAGMSQMKFPLFLVYTIAGTLIWNTILVQAGAFLGASWEDIIKFMNTYSYATYTVLGLGILAFIIFRLMKKKS
ncbi:DedA family protein [Dehalobacterium formicoaceticum]|uniref:DedA family protein n=1 Tax=Dehalobacterium formicoaceticum TaxID=51515 RepID=A0ABT1Y010_9FIRM|nr:DedA family protein [Dehalobacterium formicoaceticum]MCR6544212.1 DedA family protein [Dehalobacterium formicoaceticum]